MKKSVRLFSLVAVLVLLMSAVGGGGGKTTRNGFDSASGAE